MKERIGNLSPGRHVPRLAMEWLDERPEERWRSVAGAMVFADISGFTALSEKLAKRGRIGAEELVETLSRIFSDMLDVTSHRGGQLIKFGGDALLLLFDDRDTGGRAVEQAAAAAVEMRAALRQASEIPTSVGRLNLKISIGMHAGVFDYFLVGHPHRELVALGPGLTAVVAAENAAVAGEILLSPAAAAMLPAKATTDGTDGHRRLLWRRAPVPPSGRPPRINDRRAAKHLFPRILFPLVDGVRPDPGHRIGTIGFMKFSGTDAILEQRGPEHLAEALDQTLRIAQAAYEAEDVALLCVDGDKDGGKLFVSSGVPLTSEDDEGRMLRAATAIIAAKPPLPIQIGINRGHVFAAEVGSRRRAAYSAMGDTTNTAARICGKAAPGEILVHPSVLQHARTAYESEPVGPFTFKGKALPQMLYRLGAELGPRERRDEADELALFGREHELDVIGQTARISPDRGATIEVHGPVGVGKTRLLTEVVRNLPELPRLTMHAEPYGAASYRVFRDAIRTELGIERGEQAAMRAQLLTSLRRAAPRLLDLAALIGDVAQVDVDPSPAVRAILPAHRADRVADALLQLLHALHPEGLIVVMEDAQWADPASAALLRRIGTETHRAPWLLLVTHRNTETDRAVELDAADLSLELAPLDAEAIRALSVAMTELAPLRPDELALVVERADGSPLFARALIRARRQLGSLEGVPDSLQGAVAAQIDVLDPLTRRALSYASVLGRSFRGSVFESVLASEGIDLDIRTRDELDRFLAVDEQDRWQFRHGVLSEVIYDGLGYNLRARLHLNAAQVVERLSTDLLLDADTLALHFFRGGDHENGYKYAAMAASRSEMAYASLAAASQLTLALDAARRLRLPPAERRDLWMRLSVAKENAGDLGGALEALRQAHRLSSEPLDHAQVLLRMSGIRHDMGSLSAALRDGTRACAAVAGIDGPEADLVRAESLVLRAGAHWRQDKTTASLDGALRGVAAAEAGGDLKLAAQAECLLLAIYLATGRLDRALESGHHARRLYQEIDDANGRAQIANNLGAVAYYQGDWDATVAFYREAIEAYTRVGNATYVQITAANLGELLVNQGRLDEAEVALVEASRSLRASGHSIATWADVQLGRLLVAQRRLDDAERLLLRSLEENRSIGASESAYEAAIHLAACYVAGDRPAEALATIDAASINERSLFDANACRVRAAALSALHRTEEAVDAVRAGVEVARDFGLDFELAHLLTLALELGIDDLGSADDVARLMRTLGVRQLV